MRSVPGLLTGAGDWFRRGSRTPGRFRPIERRCRHPPAQAKESAQHLPPVTGTRQPAYERVETS
ncbi:MAG: hypothetical protein KC438_14630, partial [Thermomicrobiales bacterium]|nr:hypothetical protein [Thermomicrobiales bacterium]